MQKLYKKQKLVECIRRNLYNPEDSNLKQSVTISLGIFIAILPVWGLQNTIALIAAYILKLNKIIIFSACNISQPPITPVILFLSYLIGGIFLNESSSLPYSADITFETVKVHIYQYLVGSIILAFAVSLIAGILSYYLLGWFRGKQLTGEQRS